MSKMCPLCTDNKTDCFAYTLSVTTDGRKPRKTPGEEPAPGRCRILTNSDFHGNPCPFYKTKKQCAEENQHRHERLAMLGLDCLLGKHGGTNA